MVSVKTFTENDIYVITYFNKTDNGKWDEFQITIIGEVEAHKQFDFVCKEEFHDEVTLSKGKILKLFNNCIADDVVIRSWEKPEKKEGENR